MKTNTHDFALTFLKKAKNGEVVNASLMPDTMDECGLTFSYDSDNSTNYIISMNRKGRFSAERFEFVEDVGWDVVEGYEHDKAKALALEAGIIYLRNKD